MFETLFMGLPAGPDPVRVSGNKGDGTSGIGMITIEFFDLIYTF